MKTLTEYRDIIKAQGYNEADANARLCQDIILKALASSSLSRNATIKGGVVMRSISGDIRRATQDMDIDFIRYSLSDESIDLFIEKINCLQGLTIERTGSITELKQQDYHGKRVFVIISDSEGNQITSKIDLGVHKHLDVHQEEYCFDIYIDEEGASLLINSVEQMFTEKLRSLLKFGQFSTRLKDIFDLYYLPDRVSLSKLSKCFKTYIYDDAGMRENSIVDIRKRVEKSFADNAYITTLKTTDKNWMQEDVEIVVARIIDFLNTSNL